MAEFLIFNLYGPMAAWGDIAVGEQRPSHNQPSKSAIIGMLAAALGIKRNEEEAHVNLQSSVGFAVRVNHSGELLRDYHTTQVPSRKRGKSYRSRCDETSERNLNTILSQRDYRTDASYTICLWLNTNKEQWSLDAFRRALLKPNFVVFLGRKSCPPALPLNPQIVQADNLHQAFEQSDQPDDINTILPKQESIAVYWEGIDFQKTGFPQNTLHWQSSRRDAITSRKRWQFSERKENYVSLRNEKGAD